MGTERIIQALLLSNAARVAELLRNTALAERRYVTLLLYLAFDSREHPDSCFGSLLTMEPVPDALLATTLERFTNLVYHHGSQYSWDSKFYSQTLIDLIPSFQKYGAHVHPEQSHGTVVDYFLWADDREHAALAAALPPPFFLPPNDWQSLNSSEREKYFVLREIHHLFCYADILERQGFLSFAGESRVKAMVFFDPFLHEVIAQENRADDERDDQLSRQKQIDKLKNLFPDETRYQSIYNEMHDCRSTYDMWDPDEAMEYLHLNCPEQWATLPDTYVIWQYFRECHPEGSYDYWGGPAEELKKKYDMWDPEQFHSYFRICEEADSLERYMRSRPEPQWEDSSPSSYEREREEEDRYDAERRDSEYREQCRRDEEDRYEAERRSSEYREEQRRQEEQRQTAEECRRYERQRRDEEYGRTGQYFSG